jgi:hypothetical protein
MLQQKIAPIYFAVVVCPAVIIRSQSITGVDSRLASITNNVRLNVITTTGMIGQNDNGVVVYLCIAAGDDDVNFSPAITLCLMQPYHTVSQRTNFCSMPWPNAKLSFIRDKY